MILIRKFFAGLIVLFLAGSLMSCGSGQEKAKGVETVSQTQHGIDPATIQPDIQTNVPPPTQAESLQEEISQSFFQKTETLSHFSPQLKAQIARNVEEFNLKADREISVGDSGETQTTTMFYTLMGGTIPTDEDSSCDPTGSFLCLDSPRPPEGFSEVYTIHPGVDVIARIDLNQLAVFGPNDPVAVVSVFNNDTGGSASEILIMPGDVESTDNPDVGRFQTAVALGGVGRFTIVVSAYRNINDGEANELFSKMVTVFRTGQAEIEFVEAKPLTLGSLGDAITDNATINAESLQIKVKLLTAYSPGIQVRYEDYDEEGRLHGFAAVGHVSPQQAQEEAPNEWYYTGAVTLHQGKNEIRIVAANPQLEAQLGPEAPEPFTLTFTVFNYYGRPVLKILSPDPNDPVVKQTSEHQQVDMQFCYTVIPDQVETNSGGGGAPAVNPDECMTGSLGLEACLLVNGRKITIQADPVGDYIDYNPAEGIFTAHFTPDFGINLYQVNVTKDACETALYSQAGAFVFGVPLPVIKNGTPTTENAFAKRGVHVDIDKGLLDGDIRTMIEKFLAREETGNLLLSIFKKTARTPGYSCDEYIDPNTGKPAVSNGDTSVEFLEDSFTLGPLNGNGPAIELTHLETANGMLEVGVAINGMHGEADLKPVEPTGNTFNGMDLGFLPITFSMARLEMNLGITFPMMIDSDGDGELDTRGLDIVPIPGKPLYKMVGDGPLGKVAYINSNRNPLAAGLELLDWQSGLLTTTFNTIMGGTLLCGVEKGQNNTNSGAIGKAVVDLQNILSKNSNLFRLPLDMELLGKSLQMDVAYDALKADIDFDSEGIHIRNIPIRVNPAPNRLLALAEQYSQGFFGAVSRWMNLSENGPQKNITNSFHKLGLLVGEDTFNQALFGAIASGLLDLDVDANFYSNLNIIPNEELAPDGEKLAPEVDINRDGVVDETDERTPVQLQIRPDKRTPPMLTFLTDEEVAEFAQEEQEMGSQPGDGDGDGDGDTGGDGNGGSDGGAGGETERPFFVPGEGYFRLSVANLEIAAYKQEFIPDSLGGSRTYCKLPWETDPAIVAKGYCKISSAVLIDDNEDVSDTPACEGGELVTLPYKNGANLSHQPKTAETLDETVPLYRIKINLIAHGKVTGINREKSDAALVTDPDTPVKTVVHIQMAPSPVSTRALIPAVEMIENNTGLPDDKILSRWDTILTGAIGDNCRGLNEFRIPIPEKLEFDLEQEGILSDLGLQAVDLGDTPEKIPDVFLDDNRLYLDLLVFADLKFAGENNGSDGM